MRNIHMSCGTLQLASFFTPDSPTHLFEMKLTEQQHSSSFVHIISLHSVSVMSSKLVLYNWYNAADIF